MKGGKVDARLMRDIAEAVLASYSPGQTLLRGLPDAHTRQLERLASEVVGQKLYYYRGFAFLVSSTTIESVTSGEGCGWHTDGTCADVDGTCWNFWLNLFNCSSGSAIEVIERALNSNLYDFFGAAPCSLRVVHRSRAPSLFLALNAGDEDLLITNTSQNKGITIRSDDLCITRVLPRPAHYAVFEQSEIHRGVHEEGLRLQVTFKFLPSATQLKSNAEGPCSEGAHSKHGRLEADVFRSLLKHLYDL